MKLRHLEVLHAIMQTGSLTNAAKLLSVTQPSVSSTLQQCETQLRMQLFERVGGRLKPTPEAQALLPQIKDVFERLERVSGHAVALASGRVGSISIGGTLTLSNGYLVEAVAQFQKKSPDVNVLLYSLETPEIIERVIWQELDIGVCYGPLTDAALDVEPLTSKDLICVLPENHHLVEKSALQISDISSEPLITYGPNDWLRKNVEEFFRGTGQVPRFSVQVSQAITAVRLVQAGAGIAIVTPFILDVLSPPGVVTRALLPRRSLEVNAIFAATSVRSRATTEFVKVLKSVVDQEHAE